MRVNPFAPPVTEGPATGQEIEPNAIPRSAVLVARGYLVFVVVGLVVGALAGLGMHLELWDAGGTFSPDAYVRLLGVHGATATGVVLGPAMFGVVANLLVPRVMRRSRLPTIALAAIGLASWVIGTGVFVFEAVTSRGWELGPPGVVMGPALYGLGLLTAGLTLQGVHLTAVIGSGWRGASTTGRIVSVVLVGALAWQVAALVTQIVEHFSGIRYGTGMHTTIADGFSGLVTSNLLAALAVATWLVARHAPRSDALIGWLFVGLLGVFAGHLGRPEWTYKIASVTGKLVVFGLWLRLSINARKWGSGPLLFVWLGVAPGLIVLGPIRATLAAVNNDVHLHDTLFVVGHVHIAVAIVVLALFAAVGDFADVLLDKIPRRWPTRIGAVLLSAGMIGHVVAMLMLGNRGMPRRYYQYPPDFEPLQRAAALAAVVAVAGLALVIYALVAGRKRAQTVADDGGSKAAV